MGRGMDGGMDGGKEGFTVGAYGGVLRTHALWNGTSY